MKTSPVGGGVGSVLPMAFGGVGPVTSRTTRGAVAPVTVTSTGFPVTWRVVTDVPAGARPSSTPSRLITSSPVGPSRTRSRTLVVATACCTDALVALRATTGGTVGVRSRSVTVPAPLLTHVESL